jgi:hypothetical protein
MKSLYKSKTFQLAVLQALMGVVIVFQTSYPEIGGLVLLKSVLDVFLRVVTEESVRV